MTTAQHLSASADWGTPDELVNLGKAVLGPIDLDPATSTYWNERPGGVDARMILTERGELDVWRYPGERPLQSVFVNPPGDRSGQLVKAFWSRLLRGYLSGSVDSAVWVGFSLEQLVSCQHEQVAPIDFPIVIPRRRIAYLRRGLDGSPQRADQPTHGSYITLLPSRDPARALAQRLTWFQEGSKLGAVRW